MNNDNENLIAYCGLYCGDCFAHKGRIMDLAKDLRKELRQVKFERHMKNLRILKKKGTTEFIKGKRYW